MHEPEGQEKLRKVRELTKLAEGGWSRLVCSSHHPNFIDAVELHTTASALALAWVAKNPNTSTVILGASRPDQVQQNLKALEVIPKLTAEVLEKIEKILGNLPEAVVCTFNLCGSFC